LTIIRGHPTYIKSGKDLIGVKGIGAFCIDYIDKALNNIKARANGETVEYEMEKR
jgi:hypothetical protein